MQETSSVVPEDLLLEVRNIHKQFPGVKALNNVSFQLRHGEIHGLVGENGAGKSPLLKILSGVYQPDEGEIWMNGSQVVFKHPIEAQNAGICMEYQEKTAFPNLSVGENIAVGHLSAYSVRKRSPIVTWKNVHNSANDILQSLNFPMDTKQKVSDISPEKQQIVQIARAIAIKGKILILDEPTAAISFSQVENLFNILRKLKNEGYSIIYVSHHLKEVFRITDRVTVLKDGECVGTYNTSELDEKEMMRLMGGRNLVQQARPVLEASTPIAFSVENLSSKDGDLKDVAFHVRQGEILGIAGLWGSGKDTLGRAIAGLKPLISGNIRLEQQVFKPRSPKYAIKRGITILPAERSIEGLILRQSLSFNITLSSLDKVSKIHIINHRREEQVAIGAAQSVNLKYVTIKQPAMSLSGGNQQRLMIARAFLTNSKVIVFNEPTQGVDVGAKREIHKLIRDFADQGGAVVLITSELPELLTYADRIVVMAQGRLVAEYNNFEASEENLLADMIG